MSIVTHGDEATLEQIVKHSTSCGRAQGAGFPRGRMRGARTGTREVSVDSKSRAKVMQVADTFHAKSWMCNPRARIEITDDKGKVEKFIGLMSSFGVQEITRTGKVALPRK